MKNCDSCGKSYIFMKLYPLNPYSDFMVCNKCLAPDSRRKELFK